MFEDHEDSDVAVVEPPTQVRPKNDPQQTQPKLLPRYHVLLWNDNDHSVEYVQAMLRELFGHPAQEGKKIAMDVDSTGRAIVLTTTKEHAELKRDQIHAYGKDDLVDGCKGSMSSSIEPETG